MGVGKTGLIMTIIGGIGLGFVWYFNKMEGVEIPRIEIVAPAFGALFVIGILVAHYGGKSHLRKHGYAK